MKLLFSGRTSIHQENMILNGYPKSFIEKEIKKNIKKDGKDF